MGNYQRLARCGTKVCWDLVSGSISARELIWAQSAGATFFQIKQGKSPVCCLSINYSVFFQKKSQSQLWSAGGNWVAKPYSLKSLLVQLIVTFNSLAPINCLGGIAAGFAAAEGFLMCASACNFSLLKYLRLKED